jgi:hypothetical protein
MMTNDLTTCARNAAIAGLTLLSAACADASAQAANARWTPVAFAAEPGKAMLIFVDKSSIRRSGTDIDLVTLAVRKEVSAEGVDSVRERNRFFCDTREAQSLGQEYLGGGKLVHKGEAEPAGVAYPEGSAWRTLIDSVCKDDMTADATDDPHAVTDAHFRN